MSASSSSPCVAALRKIAKRQRADAGTHLAQDACEGLAPLTAANIDHGSDDCQREALQSSGHGAGAPSSTLLRIRNAIASQLCESSVEALCQHSLELTSLGDSELSCERLQGHVLGLLQSALQDALDTSIERTL